MWRGGDAGGLGESWFFGFGGLVLDVVGRFGIVGAVR